MSNISKLPLITDSLLVTAEQLAGEIFLLYNQLLTTPQKTFVSVEGDCIAVSVPSQLRAYIPRTYNGITVKLVDWVDDVDVGVTQIKTIIL